MSHRVETALLHCINDILKAVNNCSDSIAMLYLILLNMETCRNTRFMYLN